MADINIGLNNLAGTLNTARASHLVNDADPIDISNFEMEREGEWIARMGCEYESENAAAGRVYSIESFVSASGTEVLIKDYSAEYLYATWRNKVYRIKLDGSSTVIEQSSNGSTWSDLTGSPANCVGICLYRDRLFAVDKNSVLYFSAYNDETAWAISAIPTIPLTDIAAGNYPVNVNSGNIVMGLASNGAYIYLFKDRMYHYFYGDPPAFPRTEGSRYIGCVAPRSIVVFDGQVCFMSREGAYLVENNNLYRIGMPLDPTWMGISFANRKLFVGGREHDQYWLAVQGDGAKTVYVYHMRFKRWWKHIMTLTESTISSMATKQDGTLLIGAYETKHIFKRTNTANKDGATAFNSYIRTKDFDADLIDMSKLFDTIYLMITKPLNISDYIVKASWYVNHSINSSAYDNSWTVEASTIDTNEVAVLKDTIKGNEIKSAVSNAVSIGLKISFEPTTAQANQRCKFSGFRIEGQANKRK